MKNLTQLRKRWRPAQLQPLPTPRGSTSAEGGQSDIGLSNSKMSQPMQQSESPYAKENADDLLQNVNFQEGSGANNMEMAESDNGKSLGHVSPQSQR